MRTITELPSIVGALPSQARARFECIFDIEVVHGQCVVPDTLREWAAERFGSVEAVEHQEVARVFNKVTWDGALINPLRSRRPLPNAGSHSRAHTGEDMFARPLERTAADTFGRVRGAHSITTGNIARWDGQHAVVIFDEPDPMRFSREHLRDYFRVGLEWAGKAHDAEPQARFFTWMWNGGLPGGASIPHAHAQVALGRRLNYAKVEGLRDAAARYRAQHHADYFADLAAAHDDVGLGFGVGGVRGLVYLAPLRGKDTWLIGEAMDDGLADALHAVLRGLIDHAGMRAFNVGVMMPPLFGASDGGAIDGDWSGFPVIARVVGRIPTGSNSSDIGAGDLFAMSVIPDDPYVVHSAIARAGR